MVAMPKTPLHTSSDCPSLLFFFPVYGLADGAGEAAGAVAATWPPPFIVSHALRSRRRFRSRWLL